MKDNIIGGVGMTNYEKIIDRNIRQMANEINNGHLGNPCDYCFFSKGPCAVPCVEGIIMWLKSEVKE